MGRTYRALHDGLLSYKGVKNVLESGLDGVPVEQQPSRDPAMHDNVRGGDYYQGGVGHA